MATDLLIGSYPNLPAQTLTISTAGPVTENHDLAEGSYYLYDDQSAFDLMAAITAVLESHSVLTGATVSMLNNRHLRISATQTFSLTWPTDNVLRNLLGFTTNLSGTNTYTATNISSLLWSPGKTTTYGARLGTDGIPVSDTAWAQSGPGTVYATRHNTYRRQSLIYRFVQNARVWTTSEAGGEFFAFWRDVLDLGRKFKVWRTLDEGSGSSDWDIAGDGDGVLPSSGAYVYQPTERPGAMPWDREFGFHEYTHPITIPCSTSTEYT